MNHKTISLLTEQWSKEHTTRCLCFHIHARDMKTALAEQRSTEQVKRCMQNVRVDIQLAEQKASEQRTYAIDNIVQLGIANLYVTIAALDHGH